MAGLPEGFHTEEHGEEITEQRDNEGDDQAIKVEGVVFKKSSEVTQDESFPPKVNFEVEVLHEKVTKQIIKEWSFPFQNVPPMADLIYEVELIGFEEAKEGKARSDMTVEERIEAADRRRQEGNKLFKDEKLAEAMQQYEMALAFIGDDFMFQLFGKYKDMATSIKNPCHLNMAACLLKLDHYEEGIGHCSMVLTEDENKAKALFRCGKAKATLGRIDNAREDFQKVRKLALEDKAVLRELRSLSEQDRKLYQK